MPGLGMGSPQFFAVTDNAAQEVSAGRVCVVGIQWHNDDSAARFMHIYQKAKANVTVGTTVADMIIQMGADAQDEINFLALCLPLFLSLFFPREPAARGGRHRT